MIKNPLIITERLTISPLNLSDAQTIFQYRALPEIYKFQSWLPISLHEVKNMILSSSEFGDWNVGQWRQLGIYLKNSGTIIGDIGILWQEDNKFEIGFTLAPAFQKAGYAFEAVSAVINYLKNFYKIEFLVASTDPENLPSINLLKKLGFVKMKMLKNSIEIRGEWKDDLIFGLKF
ncbi:MAG: GNAT family N-acetyltransferase [Bacteroidetes bacterium]|nr:GNAT family N-acetyltransferase [Bacteroidota bacterium]